MPPQKSFMTVFIFTSFFYSIFCIVQQRNGFIFEGVKIISIYHKLVSQTLCFFKHPIDFLTSNWFHEKYTHQAPMKAQIGFIDNVLKATQTVGWKPQISSMKIIGLSIIFALFLIHEIFFIQAQIGFMCNSWKFVFLTSNWFHDYDFVFKKTILFVMLKI